MFRPLGEPYSISILEDGERLGWRHGWRGPYWEQQLTMLVPTHGMTAWISAVVSWWPTTHLQYPPWHRHLDGRRKESTHVELTTRCLYSRFQAVFTSSSYLWFSPPPPGHLTAEPLTLAVDISLRHFPAQRQRQDQDNAGITTSVLRLIHAHSTRLHQARPTHACCFRIRFIFLVQIRSLFN